MKFDINKLRQYETDGWIMSHNHKELPLIIWNYTQGTQYEGKWDEITLNCRGIVTDTDGVVVAKGFKKFFNYEEKKTKLPETFEGTRIYDKVDGSYIQLFNYNDQWIVNSKGSFYSDHVGWAEEIFKTKSIDTLNEDKRRKGISKSNKGKKKSNEHIENIRKAKLGNKNPMYGKTGSNHPNSKKVFQYNLDNNFIKEWENAKQASKKLNINYASINNCCRGKQNTAGKFIWKYGKNN